jgi:drug/metabolite transporter (DMT)-like permease
MSEQKLTRQSITALFVAMLIGCVLIALMATFLPPYVDLDPDTTMLMRIVFYGAAALGVGQALWVKAKLIKHLSAEERSTE